MNRIEREHTYTTLNINLSNLSGWNIPGKAEIAQPLPHETIPICRASVTFPSRGRRKRGPPESPWQESIPPEKKIISKIKQI